MMMMMMMMPLDWNAVEQALVSEEGFP